MRFTKLNCTLTITIAVLMITLTAGCGGGGGTGGGSVTIADARAVLPPAFSFMGGTVTIQASISGSPDTVRAMINRGTTRVTTLSLTRTAGALYSTTYTAPANSSRDEATYSVVVSASGAPNVSFSFSVPGLAAAPLPPPAPIIP